LENQHTRIACVAGRTTDNMLIDLYHKKDADSASSSGSKPRIVYILPAFLPAVFPHSQGQISAEKTAAAPRKATSIDHAKRSYSS
jgi:hypothetical protein